VFHAKPWPIAAGGGGGGAASGAFVARACARRASMAALLAPSLGIAVFFLPQARPFQRGADASLPNSATLDAPLAEPQARLGSVRSTES